MNTKSMKYLFSFVMALWALALSAQTHWSVNPSGYSGHMTIYYGLKSGNQTLTDMSNYEVAAFVNGECRGIGTIESQDGKTYGRLFVYGNTDGESVSFKYYDKGTQEEKNIYDINISFITDGQVGFPSSPQLFDVANNVLQGDVNGDGKINSVDLSLLIGKILGKEDSRFIDAAGDLSGDGKFNSVDLSMLINLILNQ